MQKPKVLVIVGPTASGKSGLAVELAERFGGEVISADSRQVYRGMDIGTEKITDEEMRGVPHHLIDIRDPHEIYTAADFKKDAEWLIADIATRGKLPIVAGGTFFYVEALLGRASLAEVPPNPTLRAELERLSAEALFARLEEKDPERAAAIDPQNKRRLVRALEIADALGRVPPSLPKESPYDALIIGIETDPAELRERIGRRLGTALERGLVRETEQLLDGGISRERLSEIGLEYRVVMEHLDTLSAIALEEKLVQKVWQYAKRQLTWLRKMDGVEWYSLKEKERIFERVQMWRGDEGIGHR